MILFQLKMKGDHSIKWKICILEAMWPSGVGPCILLWFSSGFKGAKPHVTTCLFGNVRFHPLLSCPFNSYPWFLLSSPSMFEFGSPLSETLIRLISTEAFLLRMSTHVNFNHVNKIEARYKALRLNVKLREVLLLCLLTAVWPFIHCLYFICKGKFHACMHIKIAWQWKSTLTRVMDVPILNFKTFHLAYWGRSNIAAKIFLLYLHFSVAVMVSTHLCVICCHFCFRMTLFQGHVACQNCTLTGSSD